MTLRSPINLSVVCIPLAQQMFLLLPVDFGKTCMTPEKEMNVCHYNNPSTFHSVRRLVQSKFPAFYMDRLCSADIFIRFLRQQKYGKDPCCCCVTRFLSRIVSVFFTSHGSMVGWLNVFFPLFHGFLSFRNILSFGDSLEKEQTRIRCEESTPSYCSYK